MDFIPPKPLSPVINLTAFVILCLIDFQIPSMAFLKFSDLSQSCFNATPIATTAATTPAITAITGPIAAVPKVFAKNAANLVPLINRNAFAQPFIAIWTTPNILATPSNNGATAATATSALAIFLKPLSSRLAIFSTKSLTFFSKSSNTGIICSPIRVAISISCSLK